MRTYFLLSASLLCLSTPAYANIFDRQTLDLEALYSAACRPKPRSHECHARFMEARASLARTRTAIAQAYLSQEHSHFDALIVARMELIASLRARYARPWGRRLYVAYRP